MQNSIDFTIRLLLFGILHSVFAVPSLQIKIRNRVKVSTNLYRLLYNIFSMLLFIWTMSAWRSPTVLYVAPGIWSLVMYGLQILLLISMFVCLKQTGIGSFLGIKAGSEEVATLTVDGCYRIVRHPLYLAGIMLLLLNPVMTTKWLILTILGSLYMIVGAIIEEKRLLATYGSEYEQYLIETPFILPRIKRSKPEQTINTA